MVTRNVMLYHHSSQSQQTSAKAGTKQWSHAISCCATVAKSSKPVPKLTQSNGHMQYHVAPKVATKFSKVSTFVRCARLLFRKETAPQFHVSNYGLSI